VRRLDERSYEQRCEREVSKWHYDISPDIATRAARGGSLIGWARTLYAQARWTRCFTWFGPLERNTLHPWENESCIVVGVVQL
jgi:hypothetical protein